MAARAWRAGMASLVCVIGAAAAQGADQADLATINRIVDEGFNRSELPLTAAYLTDRIGGRLTNSSSTPIGCLSFPWKRNWRSDWSEIVSKPGAISS